MQVKLRQHVHGPAGGEWVDEKIEAASDSFQLQGNIRHDAQNGKNCDDCTEYRRLAVTAGNKVGDTGDVLFLADTDYLA